MTEGIHAIAIHLGDRSGPAELKVSADEHHADGVAGLERPFKRHFTRMKACSATAGWDESISGKCGRKKIGRLRLET